MRMSWSKRKRGNVQRTHMNRKRNRLVFARKERSSIGQGASGQNGTAGPPRKSVTVRHAITVIAQYSPRKKSANFIDEYSVWKPPTSSGSHSAKSKGWRFVSANVATTKSRNA